MATHGHPVGPPGEVYLYFLLFMETGKPGERKWNMNYWPKAPNFFFFVTIKKLSSELEALHFLWFSAKRRDSKLGIQRWSWKIKKWSWKNILYIYLCIYFWNPVVYIFTHFKLSFFSYL